MKLRLYFLDRDGTPKMQIEARKLLSNFIICETNFLFPPFYVRRICIQFIEMYSEKKKRLQFLRHIL